MSLRRLGRLPRGKSKGKSALVVGDDQGVGFWVLHALTEVGI